MVKSSPLATPITAAPTPGRSTTVDEPLCAWLDQNPESIQALPPITYGRFLNRLPEILRRSRNYKTSQWNGDEVKTVQAARLTRLLLNCLVNIPAYADIDMSPEEVRHDPHAALRRFPFATKPGFQARTEDHVSDKLDSASAFRVRTSGSTGVPLTIVDDEQSLVECAASNFRIFEAYGLHPGIRKANIIADAARPGLALEAQLLSMISELATVNMVSADGSLDDGPVAFIEAWCPDVLFGNPSDLVLAASACRRNGFRPRTVRLVLACGENLSSNARRHLAETFGCPVMQVYSMQECKSIAWECPQGGLHVAEERALIERVDQGDRASIVLTHLCNASMPIVRYVTGDVCCAIPGCCSCGRQLTTLSDFEGRARGFIISKDCRLFNPRAAKLYLTDLPIRAWRMVQHTAGTLEIEVLPSESPLALDTVRQVLEPMFANCIEIVLTIVGPERFVTSGKKFQMMELHAYREMLQH